MHQTSTKSFRLSAAHVVVLALLFLGPPSVAAIDLDVYQRNLNTAVEELQLLSDSEEEESTDEYNYRFEQAIRSIRMGLPRNQTVESEGQVYNVDNSWLHSALDELENAVDRPEKIEQIVENLQAMEARIAERREAIASRESKDAAKSRLESILARPEYTTKVKGPNALARLMRDFIEWLRKLLPKPRTAEPRSIAWLTVVAKVAVVLGGLVLLVFLGRLLLNRFRRTRAIKPRKKREPRIVLGERLEPEQTATDLLSEAEALARSGDLRAAIRKGYIALLVELGDRKIISLAQHKTNRDYLNALRARAPLHSQMSGLTNSFERHWYGFAEASQSDWQNFRDGYLAALRSGN
jgi:hypothetical protein